MALLISDINHWLTKTMLNIVPSMTDNFSKGHPFLDQLKRKGAIEYEDGVVDQNNNPGVIKTLMVNGSNNTGFMKGPYDEINLTPTTGDRGARYYFKVQRGGIVLAYLHELANSGKKQMVKLLSAEKKRLDSEFPEQQEKSLIWDTVAGGPVGLVHLAWPYNDGTGDVAPQTVAGLGEGGADQSTGSWNVCGGIENTNTVWRNKVIQCTALSTKLLSDQMDDLQIEIMGEGKGVPDLWVADKIAYKAYAREAKDNHQIQSNGVLKKADLSYPHLIYDGHELIYAIYLVNPDDASRGIIFGINTKFTKLTVWKQVNMKVLPFVGPWQGKGQLMRSSAILHGYCMTTDNRRTLGVIANIPTS